jgi:hypothetical protein
MGYIITGRPADDTEIRVIFGSRASKPVFSRWLSGNEKNL